MQWINLALVQATRKTAPPNGYRRKEEYIGFLTMPDLWVVSVEKPELFRVFLNDYSQPLQHIAGHRFLVGTCYCRQTRYLIVNSVLK